MNHSRLCWADEPALAKGDQDSGSGLVLIISAGNKELDNGKLFEFACEVTLTLRVLMFELLKLLNESVLSN